MKNALFISFIWNLLKQYFGILYYFVLKSVLNQGGFVTWDWLQALCYPCLDSPALISTRCGSATSSTPSHWGSRAPWRSNPGKRIGLSYLDFEYVSYLKSWCAFFRLEQQLYDLHTRPSLLIEPPGSREDTWGHVYFPPYSGIGWIFSRNKMASWFVEANF